MATALPLLAKLEDCASWNQTVAPFIPQLYELPARIAANIGSIDGLRQVYIETNPLISGFAASLALAVVFFLVAEFNRNYSQVDRAWSLLPNLYVLHFCLWARLAGVEANRVEFLASATMVWSARLTYNYNRKGGYNVGSEDYRWAIVKSKVPALVFVIFDLVFIAAIQNVLLFAFSAGPAYILMLTSKFEPEITSWDWGYMSILLGLVFMEWVSDGQQWSFQEAKRAYLRDAKVPANAGYTREELDLGFVTTGMWGLSRHPNFAAEQLIWFMLYQWSCYAAKVLHSWAFAGSASLLLLFQGSTWLTEAITAGKYPGYTHYRQKVGCFIPTSIRPYQPKKPTVIRTSELDKRYAEKQKAKGKGKK
ncbi:hypothetical protein F5X68DRAFT_133951 [Plectosphaerella plurivora]|uniref:DUF1295 domain-containing protein n=1 Tax=Plectosphaerella plurivora TaxID=936078 RepID=A0A9P8VAW7_9PEZI|nr:hypothetical protein F5X68DRAFT_133951 [Plectosphaerella plurivora]